MSILIFFSKIHRINILIFPNYLYNIIRLKHAQISNDFFTMQQSLIISDLVCIMKGTNFILILRTINDT